MADIHILQNVSAPADHVRAYRALFQSIERGQNMGCRHHHIKAIAASLEAAHHDLQMKIENMRLMLPLPGLDLGALADELDAWSQRLASFTATIAHDAFERRAGALVDADTHNLD